MSQKPSSSQSLLSLPAKKFFAAQIPSCSQNNKDSASSNIEEWMYKSNRRTSISFSQIWIQGIVVLVSSDGNDMLVDDGTGIVHVTGLIKLVKNLLITKGKGFYTCSRQTMGLWFTFPLANLWGII